MKQVWYLIAIAEKDSEPCTFRIVRFQSLRMTDKPAVIPGEFDLTMYLGNALSVYRGDSTHVVELRFKPEIACVIQEISGITLRTRRCTAMEL